MASNSLQVRENVFSFSHTQQNVAMRNAMLLLGGSVLTAVVTSYFLLTTMYVSSGMSLIAILAVMGLSFVVPRMGDSPAGYVLTLVAGGLLGTAVVPQVAYLIGVGKASVVLNALLATGVLFASLSIYAMVSKRDFTGLMSFLFPALLAAVILGFVNLLFLKSSFVSLAISYVVALVSCGLILVRVSSAIRDGVYSSVMLAFDLLLDIYNLFVALLSIFSNRE